MRCAHSKQNRGQTGPAQESLPDLPAPVYLAKEVDTQLGIGRLLLGALSKVTRLKQRKPNRMADLNSTGARETRLHFHGDGFWTLAYPLRFFGMQLGRRVCILRIGEDGLAIHSTGPFTEADVRAIESVGKPAIMLDATTMHDTYSKEACDAFPEATYLVPEGFPKKAKPSGTQPLYKLSSLTNGEIETVRLRGIRFLNEYACFHPASRTLIFCDLVFNLTEAKGWTRWCMKNLLGVKQWPAIDRPVRWSVTDKAAFTNSLNRIFQWDFERVVVAHGSLIEADGKHLIAAAVKRAGFDLRQ